MKEQLIKIIENEENIIPFLKELTDKDKKSLVLTLKKLHKKYFDSGQSSYSKKFNKKRGLIEKAIYVCCNKKDAQRLISPSGLSISNDYLQNVIPWYKPQWYSEVINEDMPWQLDYDKIIELKAKGILEPSDTLIARALTRVISETKWEKNVGTPVYTPNNLLKYEETLKCHIWILFEIETDINWYGEYDGIDFWVETFLNFSAEGKIDRKRVIKETISIFTKNFNRHLTYWFSRLLASLKLTPNEVLEFQNDLFSGLNSPYLNVVNNILKYFKTVANKKEFDYKIILENSSVLLNSETKSVVTSTLMIFDKIGKLHKSARQEIVLKSCEALLNTDEKIQERASKIIVKYASKNEELTNEISMYADSLYSSSKDILKDFISIENDTFDDDFEEVTEISFLNEEIEKYETFDELLFFVSQAIDNNEVYHIDLLMSNLPKLNVLINSENVSKLEPILVRSFDIATDYPEWSTQKGFIEHIATFYLRDFGLFLLEKYPKELENFKNHTEEKSAELQKHIYFKNNKDIFKPLEKQSFKKQIYGIHQTLFLQSEHFFKENLTLDLLSTPTHKPCWITPKTLIKRLNSYEKINEKINLLDFQIAVSRLPNIEVSKELSEEIESIQNQEIKSVFKYHFEFKNIENQEIKNPQLWIQSVLNRNIESELAYFKQQTNLPLINERGICKWECKEEEKDFGYGRKEIQNNIVFEENISLKSKILSRITNLNFKNQKGIYNYISNIGSVSLYSSAIRPHDDIKCLFLLPSNPNPFLGVLVSVNFKNSNFPYSETTKNMIHILKGLYEIWSKPDYAETTYLTFAIAFLGSDKTARELATELWLKTNSQNTINNELLGEILGKLEHQEYAPLKRFTDIIVSNMLNISKKHNQKLIIVLDAMLSQMNDLPIRGFKKLLELFYELKRQFSDYKINEKTTEKLNIWSETKSLKSLVGKILKV